MTALKLGTFVYTFPLFCKNMQQSFSDPILLSVTMFMFTDE